MIWDDEAEQLTEAVSEQLGAPALRDALAQACSDVQRDVGDGVVDRLLELHKRAGLDMAYKSNVATAVLLTQRLIGAKPF